MTFEAYKKQKEQSTEWKRYQTLMTERPALFAPCELLSIETSLDVICDYELNTPDRVIGAVYESPYSILIVDLVRDREGNRYCYERILPAQPNGAVITVPVYEGKFVLLRQFRHAIRKEQLCFPRGFGEAGITAAGNAGKELMEEIGAAVLSAKRLGAVSGDSGLSSGMAEVYACVVTMPQKPQTKEGIHEILLVSKEELDQMIQNEKITDALTLSAYTLYAAKKGN